MNPEYSALEWSNRYYAATKRKLEFQATSLQEADLWRASLRGKVIELLGGFPSKRVPLEVPSRRGRRGRLHHTDADFQK